MNLLIVTRLFGTLEMHTSLGPDRIKVQFLFLVLVVLGNLDGEDDTFFAAHDVLLL
jgi:hypothetical protein